MYSSVHCNVVDIVSAPGKMKKSAMKLLLRYGELKIRDNPNQSLDIILFIILFATLSPNLLYKGSKSPAVIGLITTIQL